MKKFLFIIFLLLMYGNAFSFPRFENLYPINDKNGGGYINKSGLIVIKQKYNFASGFKGDYAIVEGKNLKKGIIDKKGNLVIDFIYDDLENLAENFVAYKKDNKWGFIDIVKKSKTEAMYERTKEFKEGLAPVLINDKWGFINKKGELVIRPKYYDVSNFSEGLSSVSYSKHKTAGYINKKGKTTITFEDNALEPKEFHEGLAPTIKSNDKACSYINKKGKIILDNKKMYPINIYCGNFEEGLNVFYIDSNPHLIKTGYVNKKGKIKYSKTFSVPKNFSDGEFSVYDGFRSGMAQAVIDYKTGYINKKFEMIIPPIYEFGRDFIGDLVYVKFENREGYINKKGQWIWSKEREGM